MVEIFLTHSTRVTRLQDIRRPAEREGKYLFKDAVVIDGHEIVTLLLEAGVNPLIKCTERRTVLQWCTSPAQGSCVPLLCLAMFCHKE